MRKIGIIAALILLVASCGKQKIGYLDTKAARYVPNTINVYKNINPQSKRAKNKAPWTSLKIVGVSGTNPVIFELADVKAENGGNADLFRKCAAEGKIKIMGSGMVQLFQEAVAELPPGSYIISIGISAYDHSAVIKNALTFVVLQDEPVGE